MSEKYHNTGNQFRYAFNVSTVSWEECLRSLRTIFPAAKSLALNVIHTAIEQQGCKPEWKSIPDWEERDDIEIFHEAFGGSIIGRRDNGILIPDLCFWNKHLPFQVNGDFLEQFLEAFLVQYGEAFFNGDTVLLFPTIQTICLFHHEGVYLKYKRDCKGAAH